MKTVPFTRQEMIDCIEGRPVRRPAVAIGTWIHPDMLSPDKQVRLEKLYEDYPFDMEAFYIKKPATFGQPGERFCWCDVKDADPHIGRTKPVGVDEENAISWDIYDKISPDIPDPAGVDLFEGWPAPDGRYRMAWLSYGPWSRIWEYRGMTNSLMDLYTDPDKVKHINDRTMRWFKEVIDQVAEGRKADAIGFGDDHGMQKGPFMSPKMFRKFYFPFYKEICDYAHAKGLHVWLHCCGDAMTLLDQFIEAGFDVLHPIQKYAMDETEVMEKYGGKIAFWSGMDLQKILPFGTEKDVKNEVHHLVDTFFAPRKSQTIFTVSNRLEDNVPMENIEAFIREVYAYTEGTADADAPGNQATGIDSQEAGLSRGE